MVDLHAGGYDKKWMALLHPAVHAGQEPRVLKAFARYCQVRRLAGLLRDRAASDEWVAAARAVLELTGGVCMQNVTRADVAAVLSDCELRFYEPGREVFREGRGRRPRRGARYPRLEPRGLGVPLSQGAHRGVRASERADDERGGAVARRDDGWTWTRLGGGGKVVPFSFTTSGLPPADDLAFATRRKCDRPR